MKTRQVLKLEDYGRRFSVVFCAGEEHPYRIYRHTWGKRKDECGLVEHKRIEAKYDNLRSCLFYLASAI